MTTSAAELLRSARLRSKMSQAEMAARSGVTQSVISAYESGRREPAFSTLARMLRAADVEMNVTLEPVPRSRLRRAVDTHRDELVASLASLGATNPRLFGSVARGDDTESSDVDLLVDLAPGVGLFALARMRSEATRILGVEADVVPSDGLKADVRRSSRRDAIAL